jgi:mediator of RNA polymerase II transcription subunit 18
MVDFPKLYYVELDCYFWRGFGCRRVRHTGGAMRGAGAEQLPALVRPVLESGIGNSALRFMYALGYKLDYELLRSGFSFQFHRTIPINVNITVSVTAVNRLPKMHTLDEAVPVTPGLHLVQLTAPASPDNYSEVVGAISTFAEFLAPYVLLTTLCLLCPLVFLMCNWCFESMQDDSENRQ